MTIAPAELVLGVGLGMIVSPLFDFILASVDEHEVGSAAGVLNAVQQLAGAIGVAVFGTIFFTELRHAGFVAAIDRSLLIEACTAPVLVALCGLLPRRAREQPEPGEHIEPRRHVRRTRAAGGVHCGGCRPSVLTVPPRSTSTCCGCSMRCWTSAA